MRQDKLYLKNVNTKKKKERQNNIKRKVKKRTKRERERERGKKKEYLCIIMPPERARAFQHTGIIIIEPPVGVVYHPLKTMFT